MHFFFFFEQLLGYKRLYLVCCYHILKLIPGAAFSQAVGTLCGSYVPLFKRFKTTWPNIAKTTYEDLSTNDNVIML